MFNCNIQGLVPILGKLLLEAGVFTLNLRWPNSRTLGVTRSCLGGLLVVLRLALPGWTTVAELGVRLLEGKLLFLV